MSREKQAVPTEDFGKDHWSMFAYIETLCVDSLKKGVGEIDKRRVRANEKTHLLHAVNCGAGLGPWNPEHGTRLAGYWKTDKTTDCTRLRPQHDDWDCLDDLDAAGLVEVISFANGFVKLTEKGFRVAGELRTWKAKGGMFADFRWREPSALPPRSRTPL